MREMLEELSFGRAADWRVVAEGHAGVGCELVLHPGPHLHPPVEVRRAFQLAPPVGPRQVVDVSLNLWRWAWGAALERIAVFPSGARVWDSELDCGGSARMEPVVAALRTIRFGFLAEILDADGLGPLSVISTRIKFHELYDTDPHAGLCPLYSRSQHSFGDAETVLSAVRRILAAAWGQAATHEYLEHARYRGRYVFDPHGTGKRGLRGWGQFAPRD